MHQFTLSDGTIRITCSYNPDLTRYTVKGGCTAHFLDASDALAHAIQLRLDLGGQGVAILDEINPTPAMRKALARHHDQRGDK